MNALQRCAPLFALACAFACSHGPRLAHGATGSELLQASGIRGGLVVHVGCGNGELTAGLRASERYLVHGLDQDSRCVEQARERVWKTGHYGQIAVAAFDGRHLPYVDDLVNLLVVSKSCRIHHDELMRVLVPGGVLLKRGSSTETGEAAGQLDGWTKVVKPVSSRLDGWSHHLHGPDNNAVANDTVVGPPRRLKWTCGPPWARSHEFLSSLSAMVSDDGRLFYIFDEGLTSITDPPIPDRWTLIARDAYNGTLLWKRPLKDWGAKAWNRRALRSTPGWVPFRLVAGDDRVFVTLGSSAPVSMLDAATGEIEKTFENTAGTETIRYLDGVLLTRVRSKLTAIDIETGAVMWTLKGRIPLRSVAARGEHVYCMAEGRLRCLRLEDGETLWQKEEKVSPRQLAAHGDYLLIATGKRIKARNAATGDIVWEAKGRLSGGALFAANECVYQPLGTEVIVRELATGRLKTRIAPAEIMTPGHHPRCYPGRGTERFLITPNRGVEFVDLIGEAHAQNDWTRGACSYGVLPCNGLLYVPPNPCFCYPGVKVTGFNAYTAAKNEPDGSASMEGRLETGPAHGQLNSDIQAEETDSWPTYRHDPRRSGGTASRVSAKLDEQWVVKLGGRLTQPVVAGGKVYVCTTDTHALHALDAQSGRRLWMYTADARIDSPPTVHGSRVLFGCADGRVYCLRAEDGALAWRYRAAPRDRLMVAHGQLESPWRVHGSVLLKDGIVYGTAGRSSNLDGGIRVFGLDAETGELVHQQRLDTWSRTREDAGEKPFIPSYHMEGAISDILVTDGESIYLGQYRLDQALNKQEVPYVLRNSYFKSDAMGRKDLEGEPYVQDMEKMEKDERVQREWELRKWPELTRELRERYGVCNLGERHFGRHVFATSGFLDSAWFNRTFWMYSETWPGFHMGHRAAKSGQLLSVDRDKTYAVQAFPSRNLQSPLFTPAEKGYLLLADRNENEPVIPDYTRGVPKGIGFTRQEPPVWFQWIPVRVRAMVATEALLFVAGPPDVLDPDDPMAAFEGREGGLLWAVAKENGERRSELQLDSPPIFDGLSAAGGKLFASLKNGAVQCWK
ncbi:MAG: PQQ-binding-like beta-propeller repeat protein [Planctomycetota bacterium]